MELQYIFNIHTSKENFTSYFSYNTSNNHTCRKRISLALEQTITRERSTWQRTGQSCETWNAISSNDNTYTRQRRASEREKKIEMYRVRSNYTNKIGTRDDTIYETANRICLRYAHTPRPPWPQRRYSHSSRDVPLGAVFLKTLTALTMEVAWRMARTRAKSKKILRVKLMASSTDGGFL